VRVKFITYTGTMAVLGRALHRQEPFINQTLASAALAMPARLFRYGKLAHHGSFFNAQTGQMVALPVDPEMWTRLRRRQR
jgi:hypothetical protein